MSKRRRFAQLGLTTVAFILANAAHLNGQQANVVGTLVIAHGGDSAWNARVQDVAKAANTGGPVEVSFLMGPGAAGARFQDAVAKLERKGASSVVVVPLLVSSHSGHYDQIRYLAGDSTNLDHEMRHHLEMSGITRSSSPLPIRVASGIDAAPEVARVITDRGLAMTKDPSTRALLIVGHGPNSAEDYAAWMTNLRNVADSVKRWSRFKDVRVELVRDDAPAEVRAEGVRRVRDLIELQRAATGRDVIVVPILVSRSSISRDKLPQDIAGTPSVYSGEVLLPHPAIARWIERQVRSASAETQPVNQHN